MKRAIKHLLKIPNDLIQIMPKHAKHFNESEVKVVCYGGQYAEVELEEVTLWVKVDWLEPIEDGPGSAEEFVKNNEIYEGLQRKNQLIRLFETGETNDRKRTQPHLDKFKSLLEKIMNSRKGSTGSLHNVYCDMSFDRKSIDEIYKALKTLEET
jgi:hypothetical protein